jgi:hypothetical protein
MTNIQYIRRVSKRLLAGTPFRTPVEAVESGMCSLSEWSRLLSEERERMQASLTAKRLVHGSKRGSEHGTKASTKTSAKG